MPETEEANMHTVDATLEELTEALAHLASKQQSETRTRHTDRLLDAILERQ